MKICQLTVDTTTFSFHKRNDFYAVRKKWFNKYGENNTALEMLTFSKPEEALTQFNIWLTTRVEMGYMPANEAQDVMDLIRSKVLGVSKRAEA